MSKEAEEFFKQKTIENAETLNKTETK